MRKYFFLLNLIWLLSSCTPQPKAIEYGSDRCDFCMMTVVDPQHAAELVTFKGKIYTFDAIECMIDFSVEHQEQRYDFQLVNDYKQPKVLINALESYFLISKNVPSPMGAYLSAFENEPAAQAIQKAKGGEVYDWQDLQKHFREKRMSLE